MKRASMNAGCTSGFTLASCRPAYFAGMFKRLVAVALTLALCGCASYMRMSNAPDDTAIRDEARAYLDADGFDKVEIKVANGVVTLSGHLASNTYREKAVSDAEKASGVNHVIDKIEVP